MTKLIDKVKRRLRRVAHARFEEPIVIFESDDWGMWRSPEDKSLLEEIGKPKVWAYDQLETEAEMNDLFSVLELSAKKFTRKPFFTANYLVSNPDFEKTIASNYSQLVLSSINEAHPNLVDKAKKGFANHLFFPQYHGRLHFNAAKYLSNLQTDKLSKRIFEAGFHGGLNNFSGYGWELHSEYLDWQTGEVPKNLDSWISEGLSQFEKTFGFRSQSTIAPQYVLPPSVVSFFTKNGVNTLQGVNMQTFKKGRIEVKYNFPMGASFYPGALCIPRNVKFEPSRGVKHWEAKSALQNARNLFRKNIPVVIDTHRINYVGQFKTQGISELRLLLDGLENEKVIFMSAVELSEAIRNDGVYKSCFDGKSHKITPIKSGFMHRILRNHLK